MIHSRGPLQALHSPALSISDSGQAHSEHYQEAYYSAAGGDQETQHVFLDGCQLAQQIRKPDRTTLVVGELGFGSGLNFLSTWALFRECAREGQRLHYWSVDRHPLSALELEQALAPWPQFAELGATLRADYPPRIRGLHRRSLDGGRIILDLVWASAADALDDLASHRRGWMDAWFLDGFSPRRNPDMWDAALLSDLAQCSRPGAYAASYSAAGSVRRALRDAGFAVSKRPGFGHKRECVTAQLVTPPARPAAAVTPWDLPDRRTGSPDVIVVGAGLAGAHAAAALARRGVRVTVIERGAIGAGASGNEQGVLFSRLSHQHSALADFSLLAQGFAAGLYRSLLQTGQLSPREHGAVDGCFQIPGPRVDRERLRDALQPLPEYAQALTPEAAAAHLGATPAQGGFWQPGGGWLAPPAVCRALLVHPLITVHEHVGPVAAHREGERWVLRDESGKSRAAGSVLIVAAACDSCEVLPALSWLPLRVIRGQTTQLPAANLPPLRAPLCHEGYIAPAAAGHHCIGATFTPGDSDEAERLGDHEDNLRALSRALPAWSHELEALDARQLTGRVALRTSTPDYLPLVGPVPEHEAFASRYAELAFDARKILDRPPALLPDCYISAGFGSRGLSYAALAGEVLASQVCDEPPPVARELLRAVSPSRYLLRALTRGEPLAATGSVGALEVRA